MAIAGSGFSMGSSGVASFYGGPKTGGLKLSNLEAAQMALARRGGLYPGVNENNLEKARWALQNKKGKKTHPGLMEETYSDSDFKTATEAMMQDFNKQKFLMKYPAQWNGEPWEGSTIGSSKKVEIMNKLYDQLERSSKIIYDDNNK